MLCSSQAAAVHTVAQADGQSLPSAEAGWLCAHLHRRVDLVLCTEMGSMWRCTVIECWMSGAVVVLLGAVYTDLIVQVCAMSA
jgi:hypothetical protein